MLEKLSIDFPLSDQGAALFLQLDRDVTPNNIGYKIYEGVMGLFGYIEIIVIPHLLVPNYHSCIQTDGIILS